MINEWAFNTKSKKKNKRSCSNFLNKSQLADLSKYPLYLHKFMCSCCGVKQM